MPEHWSARLNRALAARNLTPADLIRRSGVSRDLVYKYTKGEIDQPRRPVLDKLAAALSVSAGWLMSGEQEERNAVGLRLVPVVRLSTLARVSSEEDVGTVVVPLDMGARVSGVLVDDEAAAPVFRPGDIAIVDPDAAPAPGRYVVAIVGGTPVLRRYRQTQDGQALLIAEHPDFAPLSLGPNDRIVGRVVKRISDI